MGLFVGTPAPTFKGRAIASGNSDLLSPANAYINISSDDYKGKWVVLFFYPEDFTFVCPTELFDFAKSYEEFKALNCEVIACSTDSAPVHLAWRQNHPDLKNLPYMMLADPTHENAKNFEVYNEEKGFALRGLYIIDPEGTLQYAVVHPTPVGRNSNEILRVLQAVQSGKLTPCNWEPGQRTLN